MEGDALCDTEVAQELDFSVAPITMATVSESQLEPFQAAGLLKGGQ
jgi:hypothetical protein